ncbi:MAG: formate dehydrogenase accessory sulfurtransferase FdhD [Acidobacteria bacterium]|nr:formate dehydrogenase accessory sulfurtransferase FdhD [Acidobacteriota bacterium]
MKFDSSVASVNSVARTDVHRVVGESRAKALDDLAIEEPLEIRLGFHDAKHRAVSITMRTPGEDAELAAGFLFTEGIVKVPEHIKKIHHCGRLGVPASTGKIPTDELTKAGIPNSNTIRVDLAEGATVDIKKLERHFYTTSSCGVCGKSSIEALRTEAKPIAANCLRVSADLIHSLPNKLRGSQNVFDRTGGLHASALFDSDGRLDIVREDVGRHNALDKVIGRKFLDGEVPLGERVLLVSGRASFELVQKALVAGIPILAAVGAPSSLAVELAREYGMTLAGFVRDGRFNVYCGGERIPANS